MIFMKNYPFPKEHGGWVMFLAPLFAGLIAAWPLSPLRTILYLLLVFNAFFLRHLFLQFYRGRKNLVGYMAVHSMVISATGAVLLFRDGLYGLIPIGASLGALIAVNLILAKKRSLAFWGNVAGVLALSGMAPMTMYAEQGVWTPMTTQMWVWMAILFIGSAFFVKGRVTRNASPLWSFFFLLMPILGFILAEIAAQAGKVPEFWPVAFLYPAGKSVWVWYKKDVRWSLPKIGVMETFSSIFFLAALLLTASQWKLL